jgi:response regulator RpfG family c-di-GMP phosphodiesterase
MASFGINQRIADRLLEQGKLSAADHRSVVDRANRLRARVEDVLVDNQLMSEPDLLRFIATVYGTRFVSTEKLSKATIDRRVLARVPQAMAELHAFVPLLIDESAGALTVATADPDNDLAMKEIRFAARVKEVKAIVARPAAVRAAIARFYRGDERAFHDLLSPVAGMGIGGLDPFANPGGISIDLAPAGAAFAAVATPGAAPPPAAPAPPPAPVAVAPPAPVAPAPPPAPVAPPPVAPAPPPAPRPPVAEPAELAHASVAPPPLKLPSFAPSAAVAGEQLAVSDDRLLEAVHVLVTLLENGRAELRGHSATVARLARKLCERIGLPRNTTFAHVLAAHLHDLGKGGAYHLTALNVADYTGHKIAAQKTVELPVHLMESVGLPAETRAAIASMYERFDGKGLPDGSSGKDIPLGGRILALVDTYADLTQNPRNPYRKILKPLEACDVLAQFRGTIFDPNLVDLFRHSMSGDDLRARLLANRHQVLIVDPDPEETTVLELRLIEHGFEVHIARTATLGQQELENREISVVVSEIDLEAPDAGLVLRQKALRESWGDPVWIFLTSRADRAVAQRALDLGCDDFVAKPTTADLFAAKLRTLIDRKAAQKGGQQGGVSGSLAEMGLPEIIQILWHGRKTCALLVTTVHGPGEIHFEAGMIVNALWGAKKGEEAFYDMLALSEGNFRLDPNFKVTARTIQAPPEALLLEGMRILDERGHK